MNQLAIDTFMNQKITTKKGIIILVIAGALLISLQSITSPSAISSSQQLLSAADYDLARSQSYGMMEGTTAPEWLLMKQRAIDTRRNSPAPTTTDDTTYANGEDGARQYYTRNWFPDFTCPHERLVGDVRWVCNPNKIATVVKNRQDRKWNNGCLVYSFGSATSSGAYPFEEGLRRTLGDLKCEIHVFDPNASLEGDAAAKGLVFHPWGLKGWYDDATALDARYPGDYKSLKEIVSALGHAGRVIDIMNLDCEGCEWRVYKDWFNSPVTVTQILVQMHGYRPRLSNDFFNTLRSQGYATFHKEPSYYTRGNEVNYSFLKLAPEFFTENYY